MEQGQSRPLKVTEQWGKVVELNEVTKQDKEGVPIVFNFRPNKFLIVAPDRLKDWEQYFAENAGLRPDRELASRWSGDPKETISGSGDGWDDCDYW